MRLSLARFSRRSGYPRCPVVRRLPVLSAFALSDYDLQRTIPSVRGGVTPGSRVCLHGGRRNLNRLSITCPSRVRLSSRLTLIRLTLFRKPGVFGVGISIPIVVTYAYIFFSGRSSKPHGSPSTPTGMLPYHPMQRMRSMASAPVLCPIIIHASPLD